MKSNEWITRATEIVVFTEFIGFSLEDIDGSVILIIKVLFSSFLLKAEFPYYSLYIYFFDTAYAEV